MQEGKRARAPRNPQAPRNPHPPNLCRAPSAARVLQGDWSAPQCAQARTARGSDSSSSALGGHRLASQVGSPRVLASDPGVRDRCATRPRPARRGLRSAARVRGSFERLPRAARAGEEVRKSKSGKGYGRSGGPGGCGSGGPGGRVRRAATGRDLEAGREEASFLEKCNQLRVFH